MSFFNSTLSSLICHSLFQLQLLESLGAESMEELATFFSSSGRSGICSRFSAVDVLQLHPKLLFSLSQRLRAQLHERGLGFFKLKLTSLERRFGDSSKARLDKFAYNNFLGNKASQIVITSVLFYFII
jgi:hypothetical protein